MFAGNFFVCVGPHPHAWLKAVPARSHSVPPLRGGSLRRATQRAQTARWGPRRLARAAGARIVSVVAGSRSIRARGTVVATLGHMASPATAVAFTMALAAAAPPDTPVQVQMRNVALHVDADTILSIRQLRG